MTQLEKLSILFDAIWNEYVQGWSMDIDLDDLLTQAELVERIPVTEENIHLVPEGYEVGDEVIDLNHDGKEILAIAKGLKK